MRSLNLDQLRALVEVIEQRSFSAAARRLNLTQPAVSLQVRELERRFGVQLVERLGKPMPRCPDGNWSRWHSAFFANAKTPMRRCDGFAMAGSAACTSAPRTRR